MAKAVSYKKTKFRGVYQRGAGFSYKISGVPRPDGSVGDVWKSGFRTATEADRARAEAKTQIAGKTFVRAANVRLGDYLTERWLPAIQHRVKASTFASYQDIIRKHLVPRLGAIKL